MLRDLLTTVLELAGLALIVAGVALWSIPAALITAGAGLVGVGYLLGRPPAVEPVPVETVL